MANWYTCTISWSSQSCQSVILTRIINALWTRMTLILLEINFYGSFAGSKRLVLHPCGFQLNVWGPFGGGGGGKYVPTKFWISKPFISRIEKEAFSLLVFYNQLLLYFPLLLAMSQLQPILMSFVNISSVLWCYFKVMSPQIFSPTGPHLCNIARFFNLSNEKMTYFLTNMIIVAISLFSLNIFLNCFIGPMRKQVL